MMTIVLRCILIAVSLTTMIYIVKKIRSSRMQIEDSLFWLMFSILLVVFAIVPKLPDILANVVGIYSTVNFHFLLFIIILLIKVFMMSVRMSQLENRIRELTQKIAIDANMRDNPGKEDNNNEDIIYDSGDE